MSTLLIDGDDFDRVRPLNPAPSAPRLSPSRWERRTWHPAVAGGL